MKKIVVIALSLLALALASTTSAFPPAAPTPVPVGTVTNGKWCVGSGTNIVCTEDAPAGTGDVTGVGDCSDGACLDGTSDGGTYIRLYDGTSAYESITAGVRTLTFVPSNANAESLLVTFGNNDNTVALSSGTGATVSINGNSATTTAFAADPANCGALALSVGINASGVADCTAYTLAAPGSSGGILQSDGTNWTRVTTLTGVSFEGLNNSIVAVTTTAGKLTSSAVTTTQLGYLGSATGTTGTATTNVVFSTSPTLVTPALGAATATSLLATGIVDGTAPIVTTVTSAGYTLGATYKSGYTLTNPVAAAAAFAFTLPTAAAGLQYCLGNGAAKTGVITVTSSAAGQYIDLDGTLGATGGHVQSAGAAGDFACFIGVDATHWKVIPTKGTWTAD
jgi:hypothetical protein